ncbi:MAG: hypothetical protein PHC41_10565 [Lachnospiraceae bacterium]|nr:hypothetical protein [Lachnospiraceae bacterium]MDD3616650.1 hypothetical protein [Lachnospiraceae bacterium]
MRQSNFLGMIAQKILAFEEKIPDKGEDSYLLSLNEKAGVVGVFDGCGGIGARRYQEYESRTGAYIASRAVAEGVYNWFQQFYDHLPKGNSHYSEQIKAVIDKQLQLYSSGVQKKSVLKGGMQKEFPTTVSMCVIKPVKNKIALNFLWSGDSRGYMLGKTGLYQITKDDVDGENAMSNIKNDGVLTNVVSASKPYVLHEKVVMLSNPAMVITATDGCFGYLPSPMDFEFCILDSLMAAENMLEWKDNLKSVFKEFTGDDYTFCAVLLNFSGFSDIKAYYKKRYEEMTEKYMIPLKNAEDEQKDELWDTYRKTYEKYIGGET